VEECERAFRAQRLRAQTENVGLVRLHEGTELIRIGSPLRPEFAAWRYGSVFQRRLKKRVATMAAGGAAVAAGALLVAGAPALAIAGTAVALPLLWLGFEPAPNHRHVLGARVIGEHGEALGVTRANLEHIGVSVDGTDGLHLKLRHSYGRQDLTGDRAARALSTLLVRANIGGGSAGNIREAAHLIAEAGAPLRAIERVAEEAERLTGNFEERSQEFARGPRARTIGEFIRSQNLRQRNAQGWARWSNLPPQNPGALHRLPPTLRLALEMSLHERSEQFALDQELATLERDWREAEEIAAIADNLIPYVSRPG
jgi:hypothetical protein